MLGRAKRVFSWGYVVVWSEQGQCMAFALRCVDGKSLEFRVGYGRGERWRFDEERWSFYRKVFLLQLVLKRRAALERLRVKISL